MVSTNRNVAVAVLFKSSTSGRRSGIRSATTYLVSELRTRVTIRLGFKNLGAPCSVCLHLVSRVCAQRSALKLWIRNEMGVSEN